MNKKLKVLFITMFSLLLVIIANYYKDRESYWSAIPANEIIVGDYYRLEKISEDGKEAVLELIQKNNKVIKIEYNEVGGLLSSKRYNQGLSKRFSEYNFHMMNEGDLRVSWAEVVLDVEKQMLEKQSLSGNFDVIAGCTHSVDQKMLLLAKKMEELLTTKSNKKYYEVTRNFKDGLYGNLKVILEDGKIISCRYDELFAPKKSEIIYSDLKQFYRQSKYYSQEYGDPSGIGFNVQMDSLNKKVISTQDLFDIKGLYATEDNLKNNKKRNLAWNNYLTLAKIISKEISKQ